MFAFGIQANVSGLRAPFRCWLENDTPFQTWWPGKGRLPPSRDSSLIGPRVREIPVQSGRCIGCKRQPFSGSCYCIVADYVFRSTENMLPGGTPPCIAQCSQLGAVTTLVDCWLRCSDAQASHQPSVFEWVVVNVEVSRGSKRNIFRRNRGCLKCVQTVISPSY